MCYILGLDDRTVTKTPKYPFGKFAEFKNGRFWLNSETQELLYRKSKLICSYSGSNEWCHHMVCELIDLFSGASEFNYCFGSVRHEIKLPEYWEVNRDWVISWFDKAINSSWYKSATEIFDNIIYTIQNNVESQETTRLFGV